MSSPLNGSRGQLAELVPLLRRLLDLDGGAVVRIRHDTTSASALAWLPFRVLVGRTVRTDGPDEPVEPVDVAVAVSELLAWLDGERAESPQSRDADWRTAVPPRRGWRRLESVPDDVLRPLVRQGALALKEAAAREGVVGAQPRAATSDALLDAPVLHITPRANVASAPIEVTLRLLSAIIRMGFVPRGSQVGVDVSGRWIRLAGEFGSGFVERPGGGLALLR